MPAKTSMSVLNGMPVLNGYAVLDTSSSPNSQIDQLQKEITALNLKGNISNEALKELVTDNQKVEITNSTLIEQMTKSNGARASFLKSLKNKYIGEILKESSINVRQLLAIIYPPKQKTLWESLFQSDNEITITVKDLISRLSEQVKREIKLEIEKYCNNKLQEEITKL